VPPAIGRDHVGRKPPMFSAARVFRILGSTRRDRLFTREEGRPMIRVLVADDHPIVRHGIRQFVADISDIVVADDVTAAARCSTKRDR
jgi:hypothetical protein